MIMQPTTASKTSQPTYLRINEKYFPLVIEKVGGVLNEVNSHKALAFDEDLWVWQYRDLPTKTANVYAALENERIVGYYHVPVYAGSVDGEKKYFAMVQEVAVDKELRGKGIFKELAAFATKDLLTSGIHTAYTFPNRQSIHTFLNYSGYTEISTLKTYILPIKSADILRSKLKLFGAETGIGYCADLFFRQFSVKMDSEASVELHKQVDQDIMGAFSAYQRSHHISILRDEAYLRWRFESRPSSRHFYFIIHKNNQNLATAIFKLDEVYDNSALLLMDYAYLEGGEDYLLQLIQYVRNNGAKDIGKEFSLIFTTGNSGFLPRLRKIGFVRVPRRFNPRPLKLLVRNLSNSSQDIFRPQSWHVTMSDWDVF